MPIQVGIFNIRLTQCKMKKNRLLIVDDDSSLTKMLRTYFKSEKLRDVFCSQESFMPIIVPIAWAFSGNYQKCPEGGSQVLSDWLSDQVTRNGSGVLSRTRAE